MQTGESNILNILHEHIIYERANIITIRFNRWKSCARYRDTNKEILYHPSKYIEQKKRQIMFQEKFFQTQLVANYFEDRKNSYLVRKKDVEGMSAVFISDWLRFKWKFKKNKADI